MPRLVPFELRRGMKIRIDDRHYTVASVSRDMPMLTLCPDRHGDPDIPISRSELAALFVQERAQAIDGEMDDEESPPCLDTVREDTDISALKPHRLIDWFCKVFLIRRMLREYGGKLKSPKSNLFLSTYQNACDDLTEFLAGNGLTECKTWSKWTIYHDLLRLQQKQYELGALQKKGVEYCPHSSRQSHFLIASKIAEKLLLESPHLTVVEIQKRVNTELTSLAQTTEEQYANIA